jgi:hypothetical protein
MRSKEGNGSDGLVNHPLGLKNLDEDRQVWNEGVVIAR